MIVLKPPQLHRSRRYASPTLYFSQHDSSLTIVDVMQITTLVLARLLSMPSKPIYQANVMHLSGQMGLKFEIPASFGKNLPPPLISAPNFTMRVVSTKLINSKRIANKARGTPNGGKLQAFASKCYVLSSAPSNLKQHPRRILRNAAKISPSLTNM